MSISRSYGEREILTPRGQPRRPQRVVCFGNAKLTEVKYGRREHSTRMPLNYPSDQMIEIANTAACHDGHLHRVGNRAGQRKVISIPCAVTVHAGDEQFACAEFSELHGMFKRIDARCLAPTVGEYFPVVSRPARIDRRHYALAAEPVGNLRHQFWPCHRCAINRNFIRARK